MASERFQRRIDRILDQIEDAADRRDWRAVRIGAQDVLIFDPENADALNFLAAAQRALGAEADFRDAADSSQARPIDQSTEPTSFADGRYQVRHFLGEGGKKKVYLAHDTLLDREVAFALIKTEGMDEAGRSRISREAQAMGRLGSHPHIVTVYDLGQHESRPYLVTELMGGGDLEAVIETTQDHRLPLDQSIEIAKQTCRGLEFAHDQGIVHRDLKPGNVWLTRGGTAKIGDFGLAVSLDRSRITTEGTMVGTVSYMPPEQAMGGEVTPRSDLYSLGAMLYELVTGRPPFLGDDAVAIIGQHINTPPVSPTWHNAGCPRPLETLILRLLETALDVIDTADEGATHALPLLEETPNLANNPIYGRAFVGREAELHRAHAAFDNAVSGQGSLLMVVGEPGIGKTTLCEQLATYAAVRGGRTLVGHCYEEGSLSLPYLPFVEALRSYVLSREPEELGQELGTGAEPVARIVSEVRDRVQVELGTPGDPDEERYRLLQGVSTFLNNAANVQPLVLVLEDLHDADRGTLDLLSHIARNLSGSRVLVVGTYRDVEVDRTHALSGSLAELGRLPNFGRLVLRGLTVGEVHRMVGNLSGQEVPWGMAEAVYRQTEGNPLFVQEILRYLVEEGLVSREEGRWRGDSDLADRIPEGLRDVIGKRLSRLSDGCNRMLATASVIGREFSLSVLRQLAGVPEEDLFGGLEEAQGAAVIEERSSVGGAVTYRFAHAFFRQTLYEEIIAPRRIRLHQQVARALEQVYPARLEEHAAELAEHFAHSSDPVDLAKAVEYGQRAAARSMSVYAYGEAARLLEQALQVQEVLGLEDKTKRCDLLLSLGDALLDSGEPQRILDEVAPEAFALAEALDDGSRASRACRLARFGFLLHGLGPESATPEAALWAGRADQYAKPGTVERVWANLSQGSLRDPRNPSRLRAGAVALLRDALGLARQLDDRETLWQAAQSNLFHQWAPHHTEERLRLAEEFAGQPREGVSSRTLQLVLLYVLNVFLVTGQRGRAEQVLGEHRTITQNTGIAEAQISVLLCDAALATMDGRLWDAVESCQRIVPLGEELGIPEHAQVIERISILRPLLLLGKADEYLQIRQLPSSYMVPALSHLGREAEVKALLDDLILGRPGVGTSEDETRLDEDVRSLEAAVLVGHEEAVRLLYHRLDDGVTLTTGFNFPTCVARHLGAAAAMLGEPDKARSNYQKALEVAGNMRFRPEIALTRLQLAELLIEHYPEERAEALEHLDFALAEFRDMKMQPSLERALARKLELQGVASVDITTSIGAVASAVTIERPDLRSHTAPDGTVTILFSDIEGSTQMTERLGDQRMQQVLRGHNGIVRDQVAAYDGFEVKSLGDGFMLAFSSARRALQCAISIQQAFAAHNQEHPEEPVLVRIGLHTGELVQEMEDFFGKNVILASRIADQAKGGEILVSSLLKELTESGGDIQFGDQREVELKGLAGVSRVYPVAWE